MHLVGLDFLTQGRIHLLVARDQTQPCKCFGHDHRAPVATVPIDLQVRSGQTGSDDGTKLLCIHGVQLRIL